MTSSDSKEAKSIVGPTGETVRANVRRLRGGMQYKELAEKLAAVGRPIPALGLRKIESGGRRVDADDLMALAVVFGVSPLALLLPEDGQRLNSSLMSGVADVEVGHNVQWLFGLGQEPLRVPAHPLRRKRAAGEFTLRSVPQIEPREAGGGFAVPEPTDHAGTEAVRDEIARVEESQLIDWNG